MNRPALFAGMTHGDHVALECHPLSEHPVRLRSRRRELLLLHPDPALLLEDVDRAAEVGELAILGGRDHQSVSVARDHLTEPGELIRVRSDQLLFETPSLGEGVIALEDEDRPGREAVALLVTRGADEQGVSIQLRVGEGPDQRPVRREPEAS